MCACVILYLEQLGNVKQKLRSQSSVSRINTLTRVWSPQQGAARFQTDIILTARSLLQPTDQQSNYRGLTGSVEEIGNTLETGVKHQVVQRKPHTAVAFFKDRIYYLHHN